MAGQIASVSLAEKRRFHTSRTVDHPDRLREIVTLLTECYAESPMFCFIFGNEVRQGLDWLNARRLTQAGPHSEFWLDEEGNVEGHFILTPPTEFHCKPTETERSQQDTNECTEMTAMFHSSCWHRSQLAKNEFKNQVKGALHTLPAVDQTWKLSMFAVRADCRGQGLGSAILQQLFAERVVPLVAQRRSIRIKLMSQMERNLPLYQRLGFEVVNSTPVLAKSTWGDMHVPNWLLVRTFKAGHGRDDDSMQHHEEGRAPKRQR